MAVVMLVNFHKRTAQFSDQYLSSTLECGVV